MSHLNPLHNIQALPNAPLNQPDIGDDLSDDDDDNSDGEGASGLLPDLNVAPPKEGEVYSSFETLRYAINAWALRDKFLSRCHKKDTSRAIYVCRYHQEGCQWRVRANIARDNPNKVVVTVVQPSHTCNPHLTLESEGKARYAKRGVQYTQRFVRDAIQRIGLQVGPETDHSEIVRVIEERFGETIPDRLAQKVKQSILVANGQVPKKNAPRPPQQQPAQPTRDIMAERQREAEMAMADMRAQHRMQHQQQMMPEPMSMPQDPGINYGQLPLEGPDAEARPFVFESGFRVIGPVGNHQPPRPKNNSNRRSMGSTANGFTNESNSSMSPAIAPAQPRTVQCAACSGTGVIQMPPEQQRPTSSVYHTPSLYGASPNMNTAHVNRNQNGVDDDMLTLLQQQVASLSRMIELMQRKRAAGGG